MITCAKVAFFLIMLPPISALSGYIITVGGQWQNDTSDIKYSNAWALSLATKEWTILPDLPYNASFVLMAEANGKVYAIGGTAPHGNIIKETYFLSSEHWELAYNTSFNMFGDNSATGVNDSIYVTDGNCPGNMTGYCSPFFILQNGSSEWVRGPTPLYNHEAEASVAVNGKVVACGSISEISASGLCETYDPASGQWTSMPEMIQEHLFFGFGLVHVGGFLYAFGGYYTRYSERFDLAKNTWSLIPGPAFPFTDMAVVTDGQFIFTLGGALCVPTGCNETDAVMMYDPDKNVWANFTTMPAPREGISAVYVRDLP